MALTHHCDEVIDLIDRTLAELDSPALTKPEQTAVDKFWAGIIHAWSWGDDDIVTIPAHDDSAPRGSQAWLEQS